ncbi:MAG: aquaporin [Clostridia bacterium]|nr:aquaporin [Clostridia bacterium]
MNKDLLKRCIAECVGTAVLTLVACGVAVWSNCDIVATSLAFGLVIVAMAYSIGNISGCHINPAVSLGCAISKRMSWKEFGAYVGAQVVGAFIGSFLLAAFCVSFEKLGGNEIQTFLLAASGVEEGGDPNATSIVVAFVVEIVLTFIFVICVLGVTDKRYHKGANAGIVIGLALCLVHLIGLGFTGTSVNPARSLAPAILQLIGGSTTSASQLYIWILAPLVGGALAAVVYNVLTGTKMGKEKELSVEGKLEEKK